MSYCSPFSTSRLSPKPSLQIRKTLIPISPRIDFPITSSAKSSSSISIQCRIHELKSRIDSVKNTQKLTDAMKLVAAAKLRRAQESVVNSRPFSQALIEFLSSIYENLQADDIETPLTTNRPVRKVALIAITADRGLCGSFNNYVLKKTELRIAELKDLGVDYTVISVGRKGNSYFNRRPSVSVDKFIEGSSLPTAKEAQVIADTVFSLFVSEEIDQVELIYTKFVSLVKSEPVIQILLPLLSLTDAMDVKGSFRLTSNEGKLSVEREKSRKQERENEISPLLEFEQDPVQILDALMPLYLNSQILRALQESVASEFAARMNAMSNATENAVELRNGLTRAYNRERQAKITGEILEIVAGAEAFR